MIRRALRTHPLPRSNGASHGGGTTRFSPELLERAPYNLAQFHKLLAESDLSRGSPNLLTEHAGAFQAPKGLLLEMWPQLALRPLLDLGSGDNRYIDQWLVPPWLADPSYAEARIPQVVRVDRFAWSSGENKPRKGEKPASPTVVEKRGPPFYAQFGEEYRVAGDMLDVCARLPKGFCNVTLNGIDRHIIGHDGYLNALAAQLARITPKNGYVFGVNSEVLELLGNYGFKSAYCEDHPDKDLKPLWLPQRVWRRTSPA